MEGGAGWHFQGKRKEHDKLMSILLVERSRSDGGGLHHVTTTAAVAAAVRMPYSEPLSLACPPVL